jgi:hypothetical protein
MKLTFRIHAIQRMFERSFSPEVVRSVVENGETIQEYPDDTPCPSRLVWAGNVNGPSMLLLRIMMRKTRR